MFRAQLSQFFPPKPTFSEADIVPQNGRIFLVTGGASGIGFELAKTLYQKGARVYIAGRSKENAQQAMQAIRSAVPSSDGSLHFLHVDLADLRSVKAAADAFKALESSLDVIWNNAGVSQPPAGSVSKQNIELQFATNCLGPFLLTELLLPLMEETAARAAPASVRVVWTSSQMMELSAPAEAIVLSELDDPPKDTTRTYVNSKTGNFILAAELARRQAARPSCSTPVVSVSLNPGAASTNLFRHTPSLKYLAWPLMHSPKRAALTQLYAGLSADITLEKNGCYVVPWGRIAPHVRKDLVDATRPKDEDGGTGRATELWDFCADKVAAYR
ncbi:putative oxidoreductase-like protein [Hapsidospora chrysogenum ATCC 11550]|uniref:Putative oxidoreductase-like protein n=1 Tax=Hapsidospora chrysogenum (strain ATCC 11550 / CBS 779.69 / DSM 880 / IAM 14645 / JCM 23072 / IMI 49137) TaxID=857340 RepID=A0A086STD1_HAPC1|nr:putative oxidoreductase-like protein [Hapsidospora chrysogenum ATCC 11550]